MALNGPYGYMWLKTSQDCPRWLNMAILLYMAQCNPLWFKMAKNCTQLPKMASDGFIWLKITKDD